MMELHRFCVDEWFEGSVIVGKWWKFICHLEKSPSIEIVL
jgi:hypothetical protein